MPYDVALQRQDQPYKNYGGYLQELQKILLRDAARHLCRTVGMIDPVFDRACRAMSRDNNFIVRVNGP
jgi:hypothetical protein